MVDLKYQKRMAAEVMKCGRARVYMDPNKTEDISEAVTRGDIKSLIKSKVISKKQKKGVSRGRARHIMKQKKKGKRKGPGSRKGGKYARFPKKRRWIATIRPMRRVLKGYRDGGYIDRSTYRKFYLQAKGGMFKNKGHLESHMKMEKVFKKPIPKKEKAAPVPKSEAPKKTAPKKTAPKKTAPKKIAPKKAAPKKKSAAKKPATSAKKTAKKPPTKKKEA